MLFNHLILCCPLLLWLSIFPSIRVFTNESALCIRGPKYCSLNISSSTNIQSWFPLGLTGLDWSLWSPRDSQESSPAPQYESTGFQPSLAAYFMVRLSYPHMTTGKNIALTIWTFVSKVMLLLFNTLSSFVIAFLPRSKYLLTLWLKSSCINILEIKKIKSVTTWNFSPVALKWWDWVLWP